VVKEIIVFAGAYLLGSIPFAYLVARRKTGRDIREIGSGNVGATNVMRTSGKTLGALTLILDVSKGALAVLAGRYLLKADVYGAIAGFCAIVGHAYPIFLGFRGGKSVATGAGAFLMLSPFGILCSIGVFVLCVLITRIVSLSSIIGSASFPLFAWIFHSEFTVVAWGAVSAGLIIFRHRPNIKRLLNGTEKKIGTTDEH
jgi:acyl phosphate:glycerol-3-phosphate acyltransferase